MQEGLGLQRFTVGPFEQNVYVLVGPSRRRAAIVDPGIASEPLLADLLARGLTLELIVNTHGHLDHAACNRFFKERTGAQIAIHPADVPLLRNLESQGRALGLEVAASPEPEIELQEGSPLVLDGVALDVLHTPGHTPGGACLRFGGRMLVGDTLFRGSVGRTDLPGGSWPDLAASIRGKLFRLPAATVCYPGHGPETTVGEERMNNPFVSDAVTGAGPEDRP